MLECDNYENETNQPQSPLSISERPQLKQKIYWKETKLLNALEQFQIRNTSCMYNVHSLVLAITIPYDVIWKWMKGEFGPQ